VIVVMTNQELSSKEKFKAAGLYQRIITALVITAAFLLLVLCSSLFWFQLLAGCILLLAAWEWADLSDCGAIPVRVVYVGIMALCFYLLWLEVFSIVDQLNLAALEQLMLTALCFWALAFLLVTTYPRSVGLWSSRQVRLLMGFLVLLPLWTGLVFLKQQNDSGALVLWLVGLVATADIGAYFAGVRFGKHKLAIRVSPGKSWEGVLGGVIGNVVFASLLAIYLDTSLLETVMLALVMSLTGALSVLGDLFESMVKRHRGVKDSSKLLPGHGGILDRIDGWTVTMPVFVLIYMYGVALH